MTEQNHTGETLASDVCAVLGQVGTATLASQLAKRGLRNAFIRGLRPVSHNFKRIVGPAFTLRFAPAREDIDTAESYRSPDHPQLICVETIYPGAVLVMDARGDTSVGTVGDLMVMRLMVRGAAGLVTDGGVRDWDQIAALGFPAFGAGPAPPPPLIRHRAVELQSVIACGGVPVHPGDIVVSDGDGVVVIPATMANEVATGALEQERFERFVADEIRGGATLIGLYPPNEDALRRYAQWRSAKAVDSV